jgi:glycosyltransferase involved in cell wall biosynthesis
VKLKSQIGPNENKRLPNFKVLLSLYNPSLDFLKIQLDSIKEQIEVDIELIVRIDGFDSELQDWLVNYFKETELNFTILNGERIGACASYFELIKNVEDYEYIAFADQDDYWASSKLMSTVLPVENTLPTLSVAGMKDFKNDDEIPLILESKEERLDTPKGHPFGNALIENVFQGARMTLNKSATDLIKLNLPNSKKVVMHDAWIYLVLSAFGCVQQVNDITFLYRQHDNNLIGLKSKSLPNRVRRIFLKNNDKRMLMADEFAIRYPESEYAKTAQIYATLLTLSKLQRLKVLPSLKLSRSRKSELYFFYFLIFLRKKARTN